MTPSIVSVGTALPGEPLPQEKILRETMRLWESRDLQFDAEWVEHFFESVGVDQRHLALPPEKYLAMETFGDSNRHFIEEATRLGAQSIESACERADIAPDDIDAIFFTTVTGVASPSIDAKVINALEMGRQTRRTPMFGLGCVGGAAGVARMADYLKGHPDHTAVLLSVELCSLTIERHDLSVADYIAAGLFGDGAAAVVGMGAEAADAHGTDGPRVVDSRSFFYRDTEWVMGWDIDHEGFGLVLSGDLPEVIRTELPSDAREFFGEIGFGHGDVTRWISHPGGPKVLEALTDALELPDDALDSAWESLRSVGNLSSASVLHVLKGAVEESSWRPEGGRGGEPAAGVLMAMGPGFSAEFVALERP
jgi:alkylresorcinol/alkylpyrone synthase